MSSRADIVRGAAARVREIRQRKQSGRGTLSDLASKVKWAPLIGELRKQQAGQKRDQVLSVRIDAADLGVVDGLTAMVSGDGVKVTRNDIAYLLLAGGVEHWHRRLAKLAQDYDNPSELGVNLVDKAEGFAGGDAG